MARIDVQALLQPVSEESPAGRDCEYEQPFIELEVAAKGKEEHESAGITIPAEPPSWPDVAQKASELFSDTKDLRVAMHLTRAVTNTDGIAGLADGLELIAEMLSELWDTLFPPLFDDGDATLRSNSLLPLNDATGLVRDLSAWPIVSSRRAGQYSTRQIKLAVGELQPREDEESPDAALVEAAFGEADSDGLRKMATDVARAQEGLKKILEIFSTNAEDQAPSFELLEKELAFIGETLALHLHAGVPSETDDGEPAPGVESSASGVAASGVIRSRSDAVQCLENVASYFRDHEPSSPVPFLLDRAKGLIAKDYLEIMANLTPGSVNEATTILKGDQNG